MFKIRHDVIHIPTMRKCKEGEEVEATSAHDFAQPYFVEIVKELEMKIIGGKEENGNKNIVKKKRMHN